MVWILSYQPLAALSHRLVAKQHVPVAKGPCPGQLQSKFAFKPFEHGLSLSKNDWVQQHLIFINQSRLSQLRDNTATSQNGEVLSGLLFELSDFFQQIGCHPRIGPIGFLQRPGKRRFSGSCSCPEPPLDPI